MTIGVTPDRLAAEYPVLYHMAHAGSWPSIRRHGLLSTSSLLDLYDIHGDERRALEAMHRPSSVPLRHPVLGDAVVRDQKPMSDDGLRRALQDGMSPEEWYRLLNSKVFFWVTKERLEGLLGARAYRTSYHDVLLLDTASVLRVHGERVTLAPMNTGATKPMPHPRGRNTFLPMGEYPFEARRKSKGKDAIVECAVTGGVRDAADHVLRVYRARHNEPCERIWTRGDP
jgi:hypothetical protein